MEHLLFQLTGTIIRLQNQKILGEKDDKLQLLQKETISHMNRAPKSMHLICLQNIYISRKYSQSENYYKKQKKNPFLFATKKKTPTNIWATSS